MVKNPPAMRETWVQSQGWEDPLEDGIATHSSILAWRIPMDRRAWRATVHGVAKSRTWLSNEAQFSSVQSLSRVWLFVTQWIAAHQASLSITNSRSILKLTSIDSVMPSSHLILCHPLLLLPPIHPNISLFQWVNSSHEVAKVWEFQLYHHSFQRTPRTDLL